jgi:large subunit ribosomal protein L25
VQLDPVSDRPVHADFLRVGAKTRVTVNVPVIFLNEDQSPGLKRGGVINVVRHEIEVRCMAEEIPTSFTVDLAGLDIGDSVHISAVKLPERVTPTITGRDFTIASIAAPTVVVEETPAAAAAAEGAEGAAAAEGAEGAAAAEGAAPAAAAAAPAAAGEKKPAERKK